MCSPFSDAADHHVVQGAAGVERSNPLRVMLHYPDSTQIRDAVDELRAACPGVEIARRPHAPPDDESRDGLRNAWLLSQLSAMEDAHAVVALGGKLDGSASLLLRLAEEKRKPIVPFTLLGGAARSSYDRRYYELKDRLGDDGIVKLADREGPRETAALAERMIASVRTLLGSARSLPVVFISYPRSRSEPADVVEMTLRRHGITVIRDEHDFGTGHAIPSEIREGIHRATVFVVTWCREYACSPHCFDELELALDRHERGELLLWIIAVDDTRVVPPRARALLYQRGQTRDELMGVLLKLVHEIQ